MIILRCGSKNVLLGWDDLLWLTTIDRGFESCRSSEGTLAIGPIGDDDVSRNCTGKL